MFSPEVRGATAGVCTNLAVDELKIPRALSIAIASSVLGASLVGRILGSSTISIHGDEVDGTVETAAETGKVDIKGELLVEQGEHLVLGIALHEIQTRTNVGGIATLGDEGQGQGIAAGGDTIGLGVIGTLEHAVLGAVGVLSAEGGVPLVAGVAVLVVTGLVDPAPVGVDDDLRSMLERPIA